MVDDVVFPARSNSHTTEAILLDWWGRDDSLDPQGDACASQGAFHAKCAGGVSDSIKTMRFG